MVLITVVPWGLEVMLNSSETDLMFGSPMPAPNPSERIHSLAVDQPACMALSMSGMPGPASWPVMVIESGVNSAMISPPSEWTTMFISISYEAIAARRIVFGKALPCLSRFLISVDA